MPSSLLLSIYTNIIVWYLLVFVDTVVHGKRNDMGTVCRIRTTRQKGCLRGIV